MDVFRGYAEVHGESAADDVEGLGGANRRIGEVAGDDDAAHEHEMRAGEREVVGVDGNLAALGRDVDEGGEEVFANVALMRAGVGGHLHGEPHVVGELEAARVAEPAPGRVAPNSRQDVRRVFRRRLDRRVRRRRVARETHGHVAKVHRGRARRHPLEH